MATLAKRLGATVKGPAVVRVAPSLLFGGGLVVSSAMALGYRRPWVAARISQLQMAISQPIIEQCVPFFVQSIPFGRGDAPRNVGKICSKFLGESDPNYRI